MQMTHCHRKTTHKVISAQLSDSYRTGLLQCS